MGMFLEAARPPCTSLQFVGTLAPMVNKTSRIVSLLALVLSVGCAKNSTVQIASSADQVGYAKTVPAGTESRAARYESDMQNAEQSLDQRFPKYVSELTDTDWELVQQIYEKAEAEGKSHSYSAHRSEAEAVLGFYESEKKELVGKVASASHHKAKESGCQNLKLYGSIDWSLQKVVVERLVERRRESSDAHMMIRREEEALGKENAKTLEKQIDEIMFASYMAHVGAQAQKAELERMVSEGSDAKHALSDRIEEIDEKKKPSSDDEAEREELKVALEALQPAMDKAETQLKDAEQKSLDLEAKFDEAWGDLKAEVRKKSKDAPKEEEPEAEEQLEEEEKQPS
jgi:hypothetical protein